MCLRRTRAAFLCLCWCRWGGIGGVSTAGVPWRSGPCWLGPRAPGGPAASSAVFPEVTADDSKQWLSSDSWLTWRYEAVIPALWMQWALLWDWVTDEGFLQSVCDEGHCLIQQLRRTGRSRPAGREVLRSQAVWMITGWRFGQHELLQRSSILS